jgi:thiamine-phosphate pyrophosphorylase
MKNFTLNLLKQRFLVHIITPDFNGEKNSINEIIRFAQIALKSNSSVFQFRSKFLNGKELYNASIEVKRLFESYKNCRTLFIVNDRADIAFLSGADGVHIGDDDIPVKYVKNIFPDLIVGVSAANPDEAIKAENNGADYIGAGPVYPTSTKPDAGKPIGLDTLKMICDCVKIPVVAIGGICPENIEELFSLGVSGIAVITAVSKSKDPLASAFNIAETARKYSKML